MILRKIFWGITIVAFVSATGCNKAAEPKVSQTPIVIKPQTGFDPEFWIVGGMGSFEVKPNQLYIAGQLRKKIQGAKPDICITSGTRERGPNSVVWNLIDTPKWLDADAEKQAQWALKMFVNPRRTKGHFLRRSRKVKIVVILVAPCTQTIPPKSNDRFDLTIYLLRDPKDPVPNQSFYAPNSPDFYAKMGEVKVVASRPDMKKSLLGKQTPGGVQGHHHFSGYWYRDLDLLKDENGSWVPTGEKLDVVDLLEKALQDNSVDYVMVGHSQGANIIMKILTIGLDGSGEGEK